MTASPIGARARRSGRLVAGASGRSGARVVAAGRRGDGFHPHGTSWRRTCGGCAQRAHPPQAAKHGSSPAKRGAGGAIRTPDHRLRRPPLYPLSYARTTITIAHVQSIGKIGSCLQRLLQRPDRPAMRHGGDAGTRTANAERVPIGPLHAFMTGDVRNRAERRAPWRSEDHPRPSQTKWKSPQKEKRRLRRWGVARSPIQPRDAYDEPATMSARHRLREIGERRRPPPERAQARAASSRIIPRRQAGWSCPFTISMSPPAVGASIATRSAAAFPA